MNLRIKKWIACALVAVLCAGSIVTLFETAFSKGAPIDPVYYGIAEGRITSSDGVTLCACEDDALRGTMTDPQVYGTLLGHNNAARGRSDLRKRFMDVLYARNGKLKRGNDLTLTLNHAVQTFAYETMLPFSKRGNDTNASAVVIENATGRIIALVSIKAPLKTKTGETIVYDVNKTSAFDKSVASNEITLPNAFYLNEWANPAAPGSVFKAFSAIPIIENNLQDETINDTGSVTLKNGLRIQNYHKNAYGILDLKKALIYSSNDFFSIIYDTMLSSADLKQIGDRALLGQDVPLDFCTLNSKFDVSTHSKYIMSSFGQITAVTPVQTAALLSGICSGTGEVKNPYLIEEVISPKKGKTITKAKQSVLTKLTDKKTAKTLRDDLQAVAKSYGFNDGVYMKTGTAQLDDKGACQFYCFCGNSAYTALVSVKNVDRSTAMCSPSYEILRYTTSTLLEKDDADEAYAEPIKQSFGDWLRDMFAHEEKAPKETGKKKSNDPTDGFFQSLIRFFKV